MKPMWWGDGVTIGAAVAVFVPLFRGLQDLERAHQGVVNTHHGAGVDEFACTQSKAAAMHGGLSATKQIHEAFDHSTPRHS